MTTYGEVRKELTKIGGFSNLAWGRRASVINIPGDGRPDGDDDPGIDGTHPGDWDVNPPVPDADYENENSDWLTSYIAAALRLHSRDAYCTALLTAHLYSLAQDGPKDDNGNLILDLPDAGGSVTSGLSVGNMSMSYQRSSEEGAEWYEQTSYGRLFRMMEKRVNADRVRVVG